MRQKDHRTRTPSRFVPLRLVIKNCQADQFAIIEKGRARTSGQVQSVKLLPDPLASSSLVGLQANLGSERIIPTLATILVLV